MKAMDRFFNDVNAAQITLGKALGKPPTTSIRDLAEEAVQLMAAPPLGLSAIFQIVGPETAARMYADFRQDEEMELTDWTHFERALADAIQTYYDSDEAFAFLSLAQQLVGEDADFVDRAWQAAWDRAN